MFFILCLWVHFSIQQWETWLPPLVASLSLPCCARTHWEKWNRLVLKINLKLVDGMNNCRFGLFLYVLKKRANTVESKFYSDNLSRLKLQRCVESFPRADLKIWFFSLEIDNILGTHHSLLPSKDKLHLFQHTGCFPVVT